MGVDLDSNAHTHPKPLDIIDAVFAQSWPVVSEMNSLTFPIFLDSHLPRNHLRSPLESSFPLVVTHIINNPNPLLRYSQFAKISVFWYEISCFILVLLSWGKTPFAK